MSKKKLINSVVDEALARLVQLGLWLQERYRENIETATKEGKVGYVELS